MTGAANEIIHVPFHGDTIIAVQTERGVYVAIKAICKRMGLHWGSQHNRLMRDSVLAEGIFVMKIPSVTGPQDTTLLRLDLVNGWLFGISENHVRPELRETVLIYKRECHRVLFEHFHGRAADAVAGDDPSAAAPHEPDNLAVEQHCLALVREARLTFGVPAARALWRRLPLPAMDGAEPRPEPPARDRAPGPNRFGRKLTYDEVVEIRKAYRHERVSTRELARRYGVSHATIHRIVLGTAYADDELQEFDA